ncbi:MAG: 3-phosphoshikimate 1-carboxyvinyltransferase, partial [Woeseiaceae bacterium]|nr:3-phosphoshikimate 1-carboxyvinyltransferase [Woeseiaceae bacterium]
MRFLVTPSKIRDASVTVPGDKSISHRALMLGSIAEGRTEVRGFLAGEDCLATMAAMRAMGVDIQQASGTAMSIDGVGLHGLQAADADLDLGNSGTAMRLMSGLLVGQGFDSVLIGDESLSGRPMGRIIVPLSSMGAQIESRDGKPPLIIRGQDRLRAIDYEMPMASAQVKSAVLLAGLYADGTSRVTEPAVTRDHTERMLGSMGVSVATDKGTIAITSGQRLQGCDVSVPADLSSAAFVILAALLAEDADVQIKNVGVNPTRTGVINILQSMGADITLENPRLLGKEPVADIRVRSSQLHGGIVD